MNTLPAWRLPSVTTAASVSTVLSVVAAAFGVSEEALRSRDRHYRIAWARQVAMAMAADYCGVTMTEIAKELRRDHTTITYAVQTVAKLTSAHPKLKAELDAIRDAIQTQLKRCTH